MILRVLLLLCLCSPLHALQNQLRDHPSPYLAMHGDDPVAWQDWGPAVIEQAREQGKLLFISSGYFSCHWCHVMQRESYQDERIAELLNARFIPVKLDRELHGALDGYLIEFLEKTQGRAGWPLNVFLTPEGYPLIGATYLPADRFHNLLERLDTRWQDERGRVRNLARRTLLQLRMQEAQAEVEVLPAAALHERMLRKTFEIADTLDGGFGEQNKFPMAPQLLALLALQEQSPRPELAEFLTLTLDKMIGEGLRDHLAGGFYRYTIDPGWEIPHFEKMLYTQALLIEVYLRAADVLRRPDFAAIARETVDFVVREMRAGDGAFAASFSAVDGAGREGGVYVWTVDELHALLGEQDTALARRYWRMLDLPWFDGAHLPRRGESAKQISLALQQPVADVQARVENVRQRLLEARAQRDLPVDHKRLAGWNGLMLAALSQAALYWDDPSLRRAAGDLRDYLRERLWTGSELRRAVHDGEPIGKASLEDYAYVAYGMVHYARLSGDPVDRTFVAALVKQAWRRYYTVGGWRSDDRALLPGIGEQPAMPEGALPAPPAVLIRIAADSGDPDLEKMALQAAERGRAKAQDEPFWYAGQHAALLAVMRQPVPAGNSTAPRRGPQNGG